MNPQIRLRLSAILFAVLWTAGMFWWTAPSGTGPVVILIISGVTAGALWYWLFGTWYWRQNKRAADASSYAP